MKMICPTCGGPVAVETFDRWTKALGWQFGVQQLRCQSPRQAEKPVCPVVAIVGGKVDPSIVLEFKEPRPAPVRKPPKAMTPTHTRSGLVVRTCVDCMAPSRPMKLRSDAQEEWRCKPCYSHKYNKERIRTDR